MQKNTNVIILSGLPGTGTSTLMDKCAELLNRHKKSAGGKVRDEQASTGGLTHAYELAATADPTIDHDLDGEMREWVEANQPCVVDWRLGRKFYPKGLQVLLTCEDDARFSRLAIREGMSVEEAMRKHIPRAQNHSERFSSTYGIADLYDPNSFDLVIDTTHIGIDEEIRLLREAIEKFAKLEKPAHIEA